MRLTGGVRVFVLKGQILEFSFNGGTMDQDAHAECVEIVRMFREDATETMHTFPQRQVEVNDPDEPEGLSWWV